MLDRTRMAGGLFQSLSALACVIIVAMVIVVLGNILIHGVQRLTLDFLTKAPAAGMTGGGIFPAIFGTFALVLLMLTFLPNFTAIIIRAGIRKRLRYGR